MKPTTPVSSDVGTRHSSEPLVGIRTLERRAARARRHVVRMIQAGGAGHLGGALSCLDIVTTLYSRVLRIDPKNPRDQNRDRFLLSAGHKALAQYSALHEHGFFEDAILETYGRWESPLPGHPDMHKLPGVEANTGALGHGAAIAAGMAIAAKIDELPYHVFVMLGDGELAEGSNWEAFAAASHHKLDNLTAIIDFNGYQISGAVEDVLDMAPIPEKLRAFGWAVREIDGHDFAQIIDVTESVPFEPGRPSAILANTTKGQGISFLAGRLESHYWEPDEDSVAAAFQELDARILDLSKENISA